MMFFFVKQSIHLCRFFHPLYIHCCKCKCKIHLYYNMLHCCHTGDLKNTHRYLKSKEHLRLTKYKNFQNYTIFSELTQYFISACFYFGEQYQSIHNYLCKSSHHRYILSRTGIYRSQEYLYRRHSGDNGYCFLHIHLNLIRKKGKKTERKKERETKRG